MAAKHWRRPLHMETKYLVKERNEWYINNLKFESTRSTRSAYIFGSHEENNICRTYRIIKERCNNIERQNLL
jgi:hypothetical protein